MLEKVYKIGLLSLACVSLVGFFGFVLVGFVFVFFGLKLLHPYNLITVI